MKKNLVYILLLTLIVSACAEFTGNKETFQWRGPNRDGIFAEANLLDEWPEGGPELIWKYDSLGTGYSSAVPTKDYVYTLGTVDSMNVFYAFNHNGELQWEKKLGPAWMKSYPGTRSTPLLYEDKFYIFDGIGVMHCLDKNGDYVWKRDLKTEYNPVYGYHGIHENLVIDGNKLFCTLGAKEANVLALNKDTGETIWISEGTGEENAYCSPTIINHNNKKYYITMTFHAIQSIDIETGEKMWSDTLTKKQYGVHANVPLYKDGKLFMIDGVKFGSRMYEIAEDGKSAQIIWTNDSLDIQMGDAVVIGDNIYGSGIPSNKWYCLDWNTGNVKFKSDAIGFGTIIAADDKFIIQTYRHDVALVKPLKDGFEVKGQFKSPGKRPDHFAQPVIKDGVLYIRYNQSICAYNIAK